MKYLKPNDQQRESERALKLYYEWVESDDGTEAFDVVMGKDEFEATESIWQYFMDYVYTLESPYKEYIVFDNEEAIMEAIVGSLT